MRKILRNDIATSCSAEITKRANKKIENYSMFKNYYSHNPLLDELFGEECYRESVTSAIDLKSETFYLLGTFREKDKDMRFLINAFEVYTKEKVYEKDTYYIDENLTEKWQKIMLNAHNKSNYKQDLENFINQQLSNNTNLAADNI